MWYVCDQKQIGQFWRKYAIIILIFLFKKSDLVLDPAQLFPDPDSTWPKSSGGRIKNTPKHKG